MKGFVVCSCVALLAAGVVRPGIAATLPHYHVVDLGFLDQHNKSTIGVALNNSGEVVGGAAVGASSHPFFWTGQIHDIGTLNGGSGVAVDVNNNGVIVGWVDSPQLFVYDNGQPIGLGAPQNAFDFLFATINDSGTIVASPLGDNNCDSSNTPFVIRLIGGNAATPLNLLQCGKVVGLDARGEVLGHVFLNNRYVWGLVDTRDSDFDRFGMMSSHVSATAIDKITDHVAGNIQVNNNLYPVLYLPAKDKIIRIPPTSPELSTGLAFAINRHDQIVGTACQTTSNCDGGNHPFLYDPGIGTIDLLKVANIPAGFSEYIAVAINDNGQIVVDASNPPSGPNHTFLLTPD